MSFQNMATKTKSQLNLHEGKRNQPRNDQPAFIGLGLAAVFHETCRLLSVEVNFGFL